MVLHSLRWSMSPPHTHSSWTLCSVSHLLCIYIDVTFLFDLIWLLTRYVCESYTRMTMLCCPGVLISPTFKLFLLVAIANGASMGIGQWASVHDLPRRAQLKVQLLGLGTWVQLPRTTEWFSAMLIQFTFIPKQVLPSP
jgi:hypothetical protein